MSTNRYVHISNSYSTNGDGSTSDPLNWTQFLTELSGGGDIGVITENNYYLSGVRSLSTDISVTLSATNAINFYSWNENNPAIIYSTQGIYFEVEAPVFNLTDLLIQAKCSATNNAFIDSAHKILTRNYGTVTIDNCYLKVNSKAKFSRLTALSTRNSIVISDGKLEGYSFDNPVLTADNMTMSFVNTIFDITDFKATTADNMGDVTIDNCAFTSATSDFTNYSESNTTWSNIQDVWTRPSIFSSAVSAINITTQLNYLSASFSNISATGDTNYTNTWLGGRRDGIGALYFPEISGVAVSASATAPLSTSVNFILSGNDPFTVFSASSATYSFNDGNTSSVNDNSVITHSFETADNFQIEATILSFNEWYSIQANSWTILIGNFSVTIVIYNQARNDIAGGQTKPLSQLTFIASATGDLSVGSCFWDFGDGLSGFNSTEIFYYLSEGKKSIGLSAHANVDSSISAIDTSTLLVSAISSEYYVNIVSAYDSSSTHTGTSSNPFQWSEFKGRVETSGEYLDTYRLSGSRVLSGGTTSNRNLLNIDRTKNFTIRDWSVSSYGPWVIQAKDFSISDSNSIISAAGCTLKNGIIYNKPYSSPGAGGCIIIGTTYDMFIVYEGNYSHIIVDPFRNILSGGIVSATSSTTIWSATSSVSAISVNYCVNPDWVYMNSFIEEDFKCSACNSACIDPWWEDIENYKFVGPVTYNGYYGCIMYDTPGRYFSLSAVSGDFDLEWVVAFSATGGNVSVHMTVQDKATSSTQQDALFNNTFVSFNSVSKNVNLNAGERAIKMRLLRQGTGSNNTSAYYWHYSPVTCANVGDVIGNWNYLNQGTVSGPVIFKADAGDNGVGFGTLKFQADDGFPYVPNVTSGNTIVPSWVSTSSGANFNLSNGYSAFSWIIDDFGMIDIDGNIYDVIRIGNQLWTVQNLKVTKLNDGTPITEVINGTDWGNLTSAGRCWYNNDGGTYSATYGSLYNWYAVNTGKLAPEGWRVPTSADWKVLSDFLGGDSVAGGKIKETGTTHWQPPNEGATNESGFSALPGGFRYYDGGVFLGQSHHGFLWSSTEYNASDAYFRGLTYDNSYLGDYYNDKNFGFSVRLVKDF